LADKNVELISSLKARKLKAEVLSVKIYAEIVCIEWIPTSAKCSITPNCFID